MARDSALYVCQSCGSVHSKWSGQCGSCGQWNTLSEESRSAPPGAIKPSAAASARARTSPRRRSRTMIRALSTRSRMIWSTSRPTRAPSSRSQIGVNRLE